MPPPFKIRALGEIAIRCADISAMSEFYESTIGLERLSGDHRSGIIFFKIAEGFGGHTCILALFANTALQRDVHPQTKEVPVTGAASSLHHIALTVSFDEQQSAMDWFAEKGVSYRIETFGWIGWRGIFTQDPEGNTVELVAYDASLLER